MGCGTMLVAVNGETDNVKSALAVRAPFCAVCAFFGLALLHVGPPMLQVGHLFVKGFGRIHSRKYKSEPVFLLLQLVDVTHFNRKIKGNTRYICTS
jgi:hypothetical protein